MWLFAGLALGQEVKFNCKSKTSRDLSAPLADLNGPLSPQVPVPGLNVLPNEELCVVLRPQDGTEPDDFGWRPSRLEVLRGASYTTVRVALHWTPKGHFLFVDNLSQEVVRFEVHNGTVPAASVSLRPESKVRFAVDDGTGVYLSTFSSRPAPPEMKVEPAGWQPPEKTIWRRVGEAGAGFGGGLMFLAQGNDLDYSEFSGPFAENGIASFSRSYVHMGLAFYWNFSPWVHFEFSATGSLRRRLRSLDGSSIGHYSVARGGALIGPRFKMPGLGSYHSLVIPFVGYGATGLDIQADRAGVLPDFSRGLTALDYSAGEVTFGITWDHNFLPMASSPNEVLSLVIRTRLGGTIQTSRGGWMGDVTEQDSISLPGGATTRLSGVFLQVGFGIAAHGYPLK
jgi:hypothetical protein